MLVGVNIIAVNGLFVRHRMPFFYAECGLLRCKRPCLRVSLTVFQRAFHGINDSEKPLFTVSPVWTYGDIGQ